MAGEKAHEILNLLNSIPIRLELNRQKSQETIDVLDKIGGILYVLRQELRDEGCQLNPAHEKKLALMGSIAEVLKKDQESRLGDLDFIIKQIHRVVNIADGIRYMSKIEKAIEYINIRRLIAEIINDSSDALVRHGIEVTLECPDDVSIEADLMELYSLFSNLLKNAMEAFDGNKEGSKKAIFVKIANTGDGCIEIRFKDTGKGIDSRDWESVFNLGFTSKGRDGTGIGLSVAKALVRQYGGDISIVASEPGRGTEFRLLLCPMSEEIR